MSAASPNVNRFWLISINQDIVHPVIIHRAILGSVERIYAVLTEFYAGKWPFWLSPRQAITIPVAPIHNDYAVEVGRSCVDTWVILFLRIFVLLFALLLRRWRISCIWPDFSAITISIRATRWIRKLGTLNWLSIITYWVGTRARCSLVDKAGDDNFRIALISVVVGEREVKAKTVNVRTRDNTVHGEFSVDEVIERFEKLKKNKSKDNEKEF